jgi:hypothetical protein
MQQMQIAVINIHMRTICDLNSGSNVRDMTIRHSAEIERQQFDIFSRGYAHLSIDGGTIRHVQTLDSIFIGEGLPVS